MRLSTNYSAGLELLDKAEPIATKHEHSLQLAQLHRLRGNLYFSLGRQDECREEHLLALDYARECGSVEAEVQALGGLGDAEFARGRMRSSREYLSQCLDQCRKYGFGRIEVANRGQLGIATVFCGDWRAAKNEFGGAIKSAERVGHRRAELNARTAFCNCLVDMGDWNSTEQNIERGLILARQLGARAWNVQLLSWRAQVLIAHGRLSDAMSILQEAESLQEEIGCAAFTAGNVYGAMLLAAADRQNRAKVFSRAAEVLKGNTLAHVQFRIYRYGIEAFLADEDWNAVERLATSLESFTSPEPLGWSDFFIARGRALAAFGRGERDETTAQELRRLCDIAERQGITVLVPAMHMALSSM